MYRSHSVVGGEEGDIVVVMLGSGVGITIYLWFAIELIWHECVDYIKPVGNVTIGRASIELMIDRM